MASAVTRTPIHRRAALLRLGTVAAITATMGFAGPVSPASADIVPINLLTINDFHGRIDENTVKFAGTVEQLRAEAGAANTLVIGAGDMVGASLFASASQQDQPTIEVMNELGVNASAVGNHEFDQGFTDLTDRIIGDPDPASPDRNAKWEYLGANVYEKGTDVPALPEYELYEVNGVTIGVIGVVTEETPTLVAPSGVATLDFGDPVEAINRVAAQLSDGDDANGEAQILVATLHEGAPDGAGTLESQVAQSPVFASIVNNTSADVDAIINGHTHQAYAFDGPVPGEPGKTRPIIQTGLYGANVGQIGFAVDNATGEIQGYQVRNVARTTIDDATLIAAYPAVAQVSETVTAALAEAAIIGNQPKGTIAADITTAFAGGSFVNGVYTGGTRDDRGSESALGNEVANSMVASLGDPARGGATIGVVNPGGLRAELLYAPDNGVVTYAEANAVLPFVNNLWTVTLTGAQFIAILEQQWQTNADGSVPTRPYLQLGLSNNVTYTFDPAAAQGAHITSVTIDGAPLDTAASYRVGTFSFLAEGGDNFRAFADATEITDSGLVDRDAWIQYLVDNQNLAPDFARHSAAVQGVTGLQAGSAAAVQVSKLDLTSLGAPQNTSLTASLTSVPTDGSAPVVTDLGSFAVVGGTATVAFTPAAEGAYSLVVTAAPSNTVVTIPLSVGAAAPTTATSTPTSTSTPTTTTTTRPTKGPVLSSTGISSEASTGTAVVAAALILLGGLIVVLARRRRAGGNH